MTDLCDWNHLDTVSVGMEACFVHPHGYIVRQQLRSHCLSTTVYFQPCKYILKRCIKTIHLSTSVVEVIPHGVNNISLSFRQHAQSKSPNLNHHQPSIMHIGLPLIQGECLRWANTNTAAAPTQNTSNLSKQSNCHSCRYTFNPPLRCQPTHSLQWGNEGQSWECCNWARTDFEDRHPLRHLWE